MDIVTKNYLNEFASSFGFKKFKESLHVNIL